MNVTPVIGLEIHVELETLSKMFCSCPADYFGKKPNTQCCPVCLGLPGALPVPNKKAIEQTILFGLSVGCTIAVESKFDRKNYFYPDLPKGYQISQYDEPLAYDGMIQINPPAGGQRSKTIRIKRVHLEEDTGKLQHITAGGKNVACIDFNRSGVPLMEIVTEPDFRSIDEVDKYVRKIQQIIRYLGISGADMEKGSMRIEPSISLREAKDTRLPDYRVEIKNINSFRFVRKALEYEINRQTSLLENGVAVDQETRGFAEAKNETVSQRRKEEAMDYRYFPEPDIPPMHFDRTVLSAISRRLVELPDQKKERFMREFALSDYDASFLTEEIKTAQFFEKCIEVSRSDEHKKTNITPKTIANWIMNKKTEVIFTEQEFVQRIAASMVIESVSDDQIHGAIVQVLDAHPQAVIAYKAGKDQVKMFLFGNILKELKGKGDKRKVMEFLVKTLNTL